MSSKRIPEWQPEAVAEGAPGAVAEDPTSSPPPPPPPPPRPSDFTFTDNGGSLEALRRDLSAFARERNWDQFHTPRNLLLAMVGEVGELSEIFQWRGDGACTPGLPDWTDQDKTHLGEEMADVLCYMVRLADRCQVDLPAATKRKMERNRAKYPAERCYGSAAKYTAYQEKDQS